MAELALLASMCDFVSTYVVQVGRHAGHSIFWRCVKASFVVSSSFLLTSPSTEDGSAPGFREKRRKVRPHRHHQPRGHGGRRRPRAQHFFQPVEVRTSSRTLQEHDYSMISTNLMAVPTTTASMTSETAAVKGPNNSKMTKLLVFRSAKKSHQCGNCHPVKIKKTAVSMEYKQLRIHQKLIF